FVLTIAFRGLGRIPSAYGAGVRPLSSLLFGPDLTALIVAVLAGAAGVISLSRARSGGLVGVFVSITTIPGAANVGVAFATGFYREAGKSAIILVVNLLGIAVGAVVTLLAARVWARRIESGKALLRPRPEGSR